METSYLVQNSVLHNNKIMISIKLKVPDVKNMFKVTKKGSELRVNIEPLVCKPKNKFYIIKTHHQKWLNCQ